MRAILTTEALEDPALHEPGPPPNDLHTFGPDAMKSPGSEQWLLVGRAPKVSYASAVAFYRAMRVLAPPDLGSLCQPIEEEAALARVHLHRRDEPAPQLEIERLSQSRQSGLGGVGHLHGAVDACEPFGSFSR